MGSAIEPLYVRSVGIWGNFGGTFLKPLTPLKFLEALKILRKKLEMENGDTMRDNGIELELELELKWNNGKGYESDGWDGVDFLALRQIGRWLKKEEMR